MSYNGSGTFVINTAGQPVVSGTVISSTAFNALTADLATGLSTAITKDGQTTPTANIPMGNNKITGLAVGTAATDAANLSQVQSTTAKLINSISGTDTITGTMSPNLGAYATGQMFYFIAAGDNTGAVTLNIDSLGAKAVTRDGSVALAASDLKSGEVVVVVYDGTRFQVVSQLNSAGDARFANVSIASALNVGGVATVTGGSVLNGGVVINEPGADADTRIEGDTDANLFFADASTDRIGVGTSSPATKLDVNGITQSRGNLYGGTSNTTANVLAYANVANGGAGFSQFLFANTSTETRGYLTYTHASDALLIGTAGATKATLDTSGNLGLGVTPSTWSTGKAIQINNVQASIWGAGDQINVLSNAYFNSGYKYAASKAASMYEQALGVHSWHTAASGTAGNAISFTQAMTLDASGNLGIGTTSPASRLDVTGAFGTGTTAFTIYNNSGASASNIARIDFRVNNSFGGNERIAAIWGINPNAGGNNGGALVFATSANGTATTPSERARITAGGEFLFNTTSTDQLLVGSRVLPDANGSTFASTSSKSAAGNQGFLMYSTGAAAYRFYVDWDGKIYATNTTISAISDQRYKENVRDLDVGLDAVMALKPRRFDWKEGKGKNTKDDRGFIAQEFEQVFPDLVDEWKDQAPEGEEPYKSVRQDLIPVLVKAIQELKAELDATKAKVAALEAK